jgi:hypothetical protein
MNLYTVVQTKNSDLKIMAIAYAINDSQPEIMAGREEYILSQFNDLIKQLKKEGVQIITATENFKDLLYEKASFYDCRSTREYTKNGTIIFQETECKGQLTNQEEIYAHCLKTIEKLREQFKNKL